MPGDEPKDNDERKPEGSKEPADESRESGGIPASVTFSEMMRHVAARSDANKEPSWTDPVIPRRRPKLSISHQAPPSAAAKTPTNSPVHDSTSASAQETEPPLPFTDDDIEAQAETPAEANSADHARFPFPAPAVPGNEAALEEQRIRRVKRRQTRRRRRTVGVLGGILRSVIVVGTAAILMATIFTWWTPTKFLNNNVRQELSVAIATSAVTLQPTGLPTPNWFRKIGIVSGHRGPNNDPGAVCDDGLTEAATVFNIAQLVVRNLRGRGYTVDLLDEFDARLNDYQATALVSIHANTCKDWGETVSGFLVASAAARVTEQGNDSDLVECIARHYAQVSGLERRNDGVTSDMSDYHTFREINGLTPAAIIETGFLRADRDILTQKPDVLARGITDGIICFLEPSTEPPITPTPG